MLRIRLRHVTILVKVRWSHGVNLSWFTVLAVDKTKCYCVCFFLCIPVFVGMPMSWASSVPKARRAYTPRSLRGSSCVLPSSLLFYGHAHASSHSLNHSTVCTGRCRFGGHTYTHGHVARAYMPQHYPTVIRTHTAKGTVSTSAWWNSFFFFFISVLVYTTQWL